MANTVDFKLDKAGVRENILKAGFMLAECEKAAEAYSGKKKPYIGFDRAKVRIQQRSGKGSEKK